MPALAGGHPSGPTGTSTATTCWWRRRTFDLAKLVPGKTYQRIKGARRQDPKTNDG